jgi:hypothetical protein
MRSFLSDKGKIKDGREDKAFKKTLGGLISG